MNTYNVYVVKKSSQEGNVIGKIEKVTPDVEVRFVADHVQQIRGEHPGIIPRLKEVGKSVLVFV